MPPEITGFGVSADGSVIYVSANNTYRHWISSDDGVSWTATEINQSNGPVAISPEDSNLVIFADRPSLNRSVNGMRSWTTVVSVTRPAGRQLDVPFVDIVFAPSNPDIVYAVTDGYLVYRSTNAGASFILMKNVRADVLNVVP